jgi:hypothetical protein
MHEQRGDRIAKMSSAFYASELRRELSLRNHRWSKRDGIVFENSYGSMPVTVYAPAEDGRSHGNFHDECYRAMCARPEWMARLEKVHTSFKKSLPRSERRWRELDSSMSSDALLMNVFCYPGVAATNAVIAMLGLEEAHEPEFGVKAKVPLANGRFDRTEVDMRLGPLLVEAKLTESDFQSREIEIVKGYRDFDEVFQKGLLPRADGKYLAYQLIRNVLAAQATGSSFCVMHDARRPDLREQWYEVMQAVKPAELRTRCKVLTWQELSEALPEPLREFLDEKYGIVPPGRVASECGMLKEEFGT